MTKESSVTSQDGTVTRATEQARPELHTETASSPNRRRQGRRTRVVIPFSGVTDEYSEIDPDGKDNRPPLTIFTTAQAAEWLRTAAGTGPLAGVFLRGTELVHCPLVGEDGYRQLAAEGEDVTAQVRPLT